MGRKSTKWRWHVVSDWNHPGAPRNSANFLRMFHDCLWFIQTWYAFLKTSQSVPLVCVHRVHCLDRRALLLLGTVYRRLGTFGFCSKVWCRSSRFLMFYSVLRMLGRLLYSTIDVFKLLLESGGGHRISSNDAHRHVLGVDIRSLTETVAAYRLRWLGCSAYICSLFIVALFPRVLEKAVRSDPVVRLWLGLEVWIN